MQEVKDRAESVQKKLAAELEKVERELWALDIEKEVLTEMGAWLGRSEAGPAGESQSN